MQRLLPPSLVLVLLVLMTASAGVISAPSLPWLIRGLGCVPLAAGIVMTLRHAKLFSDIGTNIKTFNDPDKLVVAGAFSWTRNPMYVGLTLILVGAAFILGEALAFLGPVAFFAAADRWYIPFEEARLRATFGANYEMYTHQVKRWIGRLPAKINTAKVTQ